MLFIALCKIYLLCYCYIFRYIYYVIASVLLNVLLNVLLSVACQRWTQQPNTNYWNGSVQTATSVQLCQAVCQATAACNGFDWVPTEPVGRQCWLSGPWSTTQGNPQGVTHYIFNRNCP